METYDKNTKGVQKGLLRIIQSDRDINASKNLYFVGLGRHGGIPVEQALVKNHSHPATKQEAQPQKVEQSAGQKQRTVNTSLVKLATQ